MTSQLWIALKAPECQASSERVRWWLTVIYWLKLSDLFCTGLLRWIFWLEWWSVWGYQSSCCQVMSKTSPRLLNWTSLSCGMDSMCFATGCSKIHGPLGSPGSLAASNFIYDWKSLPCHHMERHILLFQRCLQEAEPLVTQQDGHRQIFCEMKYLATGLSAFNHGRAKGSKSCTDEILTMHKVIMHKTS